MLRRSSLAVSLLVVGLCASPVAGATIGQIDTFQDGTTNGWFAGGLGLGAFPPVPPANVPTGGPAGTDDAFLQITSGGGDGPGSRLVAMNGTQWAGDYLAEGITGIEMDVLNLGASDLTLRLMFENPMGGPPTDIAVTTAGVSLPVGSGWQHVVFSILPAQLTAVIGDATTALATTTLIRIFHATERGEPGTDRRYAGRGQHHSDRGRGRPRADDVCHARFRARRSAGHATPGAVLTAPRASLVER